MFRPWIGATGVHRTDIDARRMTHDPLGRGEFARAGCDHILATTPSWARFFDQRPGITTSARWRREDDPWAESPPQAGEPTAKSFPTSHSQISEQ